MFQGKPCLLFSGVAWYPIPFMIEGTATESGSGVTGDTKFDANYFYVCIAANSWKRIAWTAW